MAFKIGFISEPVRKSEEICAEPPKQITPRKSVVQVYFPADHRTLAYYNDRFDLHRGDLVFVDGKLEGEQGRVVDVSYNFKIKLSDYRRVIAVADTAVHGQFYAAGSHFITFDRSALPAQKVRTWFLPPQKPEDEFASGADDTMFPLSELKEMKVTAAVADRGHDYYCRNLVRYISLSGHRGYAIVEGTSPYEVEFTYKNGQIGGLVCSCFCGEHCKHEFAAMLQLKDILEQIEKKFKADYQRSDYFAAVYKGTLLDFAVDGKDDGTFTL